MLSFIIGKNFIYALSENTLCLDWSSEKLDCSDKGYNGKRIHMTITNRKSQNIIQNLLVFITCSTIDSNDKINPVALTVIQNLVVTVYFSVVGS